MNTRGIISVFFLFLSVVLRGQVMDILIKNGHIIDPKNGIDTVMDVGIADGRIAEVAPNIGTDRAKRVIDTHGYSYPDKDGKELEIKRCVVGTVQLPGYFLEQDVTFVELY